MSSGSEQAYPIPWVDGYGITRQELGLTKRELFAAMAMQGLLSTSVARISPADGSVSVVYAKMAAHMADALIAALEGK